MELKGCKINLLGDSITFGVGTSAPDKRFGDLIESMYGNISGDAIPRYIATAGGKIPLHRSNVVRRNGNDVILIKPWSEEEVSYPDADPEVYADTRFAFNR